MDFFKDLRIIQYSVKCLQNEINSVKILVKLSFAMSLTNQQLDFPF